MDYWTGVGRIFGFERVPLTSNSLNKYSYLHRYCWAVLDFDFLCFLFFFFLFTWWTSRNAPKRADCFECESGSSDHSRSSDDLMRLGFPTADLPPSSLLDSSSLATVDEEAVFFLTGEWVVASGFRPMSLRFSTSFVVGPFLSDFCWYSAGSGAPSPRLWEAHQWGVNV